MKSAKPKGNQSGTRLTASLASSALVRHPSTSSLASLRLADTADKLSLGDDYIIDTGTCTFTGSFLMIDL